MRKFKNNLDEMQEQQLLKIEHVGCWIAFWGLLISILIQAYLHPGKFEYVRGELAVFLILCTYMIVLSAKYGIWDRRFKMNTKTNLLLSIVSSIIFGVYMGFTNYRMFNIEFSAFMTGIISSIFMCILLFFLLSVLSSIVKKRFEKLEEEDD